MGLKTDTKTVKYKVGEVYLTKVDNYWREKEILQIENNAKAIKTDTDGWLDAGAFNNTVKGKMGHFETRKGLFRSKRVFIRE